MKSRDTHSLARSVRRLAVGVVRDMNDRQAGTAIAGVAEREEQFQLAVSGIATDYPAWASTLLPFDTEFVRDSAQRDSSLLRPQVYFGYELTTLERLDGPMWLPATDAAVVMAGVVRDWQIVGPNLINGVRLVLSAHAPGDELRFTGFVHVTVQGFGTPREDDDNEPGFQGA